MVQDQDLFHTQTFKPAPESGFAWQTWQKKDGKSFSHGKENSPKENSSDNLVRSFAEH